MGATASSAPWGTDAPSPTKEWGLGQRVLPNRHHLSDAALQRQRDGIDGGPEVLANRHVAHPLGGEVAAGWGIGNRSVEKYGTVRPGRSAPASDVHRYY